MSLSQDLLETVFMSQTLMRDSVGVSKTVRVRLDCNSVLKILVMDNLMEE